MPSPVILIADDDPLLVTLLERRLRGVGYSTVTATDGFAALQLLPDSHAVVMVLDAMMPRMGGFEVLRRVRMTGSTPRTRVLMLTALRHEDDAINALLQGADDFVRKPFSLDEVIARIARLAHLDASK